MSDEPRRDRLDPFELAIVLAIREAIRLRREREAKMPDMRRKPAA